MMTMLLVETAAGQWTLRNCPQLSIDEVLDPDFEDSVIADLRSLHNANLFSDFGIFVGKPSTRAKH